MDVVSWVTLDPNCPKERDNTHTAAMHMAEGEEEEDPLGDHLK